MVPLSFMPEFLADAYNQRHYFGRVRMMITLEGIYIRYKRKLVDEYVRNCLRCGEQCIDHRKLLGEFMPIQAPEELMYIICMDFIVVLPVVPFIGILWNLPGYDVFNAMMPVTCKTFKRIMLLPGYTSYIA